MAACLLSCQDQDRRPAGGRWGRGQVARRRESMGDAGCVAGIAALGIGHWALGTGHWALGIGQWPMAIQWPMLGQPDGTWAGQPKARTARGRPAACMHLRGASSPSFGFHSGRPLHAAFALCHKLWSRLGVSLLIDTSRRCDNRQPGQPWEEDPSHRQKGFPPGGGGRGWGGRGRGGVAGGWRLLPRGSRGG